MERIVQVVDESPDSIRVKIRNYYEPLFLGLCKIAMEDVKAFHSDLCHDALLLSQARKGDKYLWAHRESGTTMIYLTVAGMDTRLALQLVRASTCPLENWHLIEVLKVRNGTHADGFITKIVPRDLTHLGMVIKENLKRTM